MRSASALRRSSSSRFELSSNGGTQTFPFPELDWDCERVSSCLLDEDASVTRDLDAAAELEAFSFDCEFAVDLLDPWEYMLRKPLLYPPPPLVPPVFVRSAMERRPLSDAMTAPTVATAMSERAYVLER
jgi:hypothetical protein